MIFDPYLNWLGLRPAEAVAGLHITSDFVTLVAVRTRPLRLVAVGRSPVTDAAVVGDQIRLIKPVATALGALVAQTRLEPGTATVATVEPLANSLTIWDDGPEVLTYSVAQSVYDRIGEVADRADLKLIRIDIVPASLARIGRQIGAGVIAARQPIGWSVQTNDGFTDATRSDHGAPEAASLTSLNGFQIPIRLRHLVDPAGDAAAIGAALAGFGCAPVVPTQPAAEAIGPDWTVEYVEAPALMRNAEPTQELNRGLKR